ncbi:hypothetical protein COA17_06165 [Sphingomonas ginsenosidimutans]|jgi:hypothetical protein|uniref:Uncharacterized protein n=1 Tax=Sphingomonas ginsenosidimutans TaxID=862134 RepID=A0A2A4I0M2_9SPHN|nr:hypothetical protein [Sphingomonas ginsenosidimutans]PCG09468.1 hypothetical protein COA17_06165 [Sphingomonas ginsenosidimutans]
MSDVSATTRSHAPRSPARPAARTAPAPQDVQAMREALANARRQQGSLPGQPQAGGRTAQQQGGARTAMAGADRGADALATGEWRSADDRAALDRRDGERSSDQGFGGFAQPGALPVTVAAHPPAPQVDPSGFAQMLADLWTRENGRGAREVRVRFGNDSWPATGARLVRSADGLLDVTVEMAAGSAPPPLDTLGDALAQSGLSIGGLAAEEV